MLKVDALRVNYGAVEALKGISIDCPEGKIISLIGANGAGKSTTLNAIMGLVRTSGGTVSYSGLDITNKPAHKIVALGMSLVPEGRRIFTNLTVNENLEIGAFLEKDRGKIAERKEEVFALFPRLKERIGQIGATLSGGEQQMLAIGRAMMQDPKLMLLDEPSLGLAPNLVAEIFETIRKINSRGATILLVEQNAFQALKISDYAYVLVTGRIELWGTGAELIENEDVKKAYLGI
ncbi:MAG: ABC transporter ATP-binding protein [bacterium]|jgi:branched-chain amino acid transport system ATP-binding protein